MEIDFSSATIVSHFSIIKDPRITGRSGHKLIDIIVIAICGILCGYDDRVAIESFGKAETIEDERQADSGQHHFTLNLEDYF